MFVIKFRLVLYSYLSYNKSIKYKTIYRKYTRNADSLNALTSHAGVNTSVSAGQQRIAAASELPIT